MGYAYLTFLYGNELGTQDATDFSHFKKSKRSLNDFLYVKGHKLNGFVDFEELMEELYEEETFAHPRNLICEVKINNEIHIFEFEDTGDYKLQSLVYVEKFSDGKWLTMNEKIKEEIYIDAQPFTPYYKPNSFYSYSESEEAKKYLKMLNQAKVCTMYSKEGYYFFIRNVDISIITDEMIIYSAQARCLNVVNFTRLQAVEAIKNSDNIKLECNEEILKQKLGMQNYERKITKSRKIKAKPKKKKTLSKTKKRKSSRPKKRKSSRKITKRKSSKKMTKRKSSKRKSRSRK